MGAAYRMMPDTHDVDARRPAPRPARPVSAATRIAARPVRLRGDVTELPTVPISEAVRAQRGRVYRARRIRPRWRRAIGLALALTGMVMAAAVMLGLAVGAVAVRLLGL